MTVSQKVQIDTFDFGSSLTVPALGALATGTTIANGTASTCNEQTADSGVYIADFVGADPSALIPAGTYRLRTTVNGLPLKRFVTFTGVDGEVVYARSEEHAVLNTEGMYEAIESMKSIISEWIALNIQTDVIGFPATIIGGTDVLVPLEVVDSNNEPITEIFAEPVETVQWLFGMGTSARRARILGSVEWASSLLQITIPRAETLDDDDGPRTWMIGCKLTSGEVKWVKTGVTRLIGRQFAEPTTTTTGV